MGEENVSTENAENLDTQAQIAVQTNKIFTLEILPLLKHAQQQHGLRHGDYQRYRGYCTRRIRRLRKTLKFPQGDKRHFKRRDVTLAQFSGKRADERYAYIPLVCAERAWAHAMQLKQEANTEPRKRFHLIHKLRKACFYALQLQELCNTQVFDARSKLECEAYVSWLHGTLHFELQLWKSSGEHLKRAQLVYEQLAKALPEEEQEVYRGKVNEFLPNLRYCAYNMDSTDAAVGKQSGSKVEEFMDLSAQGLLDNLEVLVSQTKLNTNETSQTFDWRGHKISARNEKMRLFLLSSQELDKSLEKCGKTEERITLIERVLIDCKDAIQAVKDDMRADPKLRAVGTVPASLQTLMSYLYYLRYKRTLQRNLCLVEQAKEGFIDPNNKKAVEIAKTGTNARNAATNNQQETKRVRAQDLARLYEIILQNVNELQQIQRMENDAAYQAEVQTLATTFKAFRCYYIALTLNDMKKWREAVALYERATNYANKALKELPQLATDEFNMMQPLRQLVATIDSCKFQAHALSVLEGSASPANNATLANKTAQKPSKPLFERLEQYKEDQSLHTKQPNVYKLTPELAAIPCKPLFFDLALNYVELPSLDDKLESPSKQTAAGISGFVKGFLGWGGKK